MKSPFRSRIEKHLNIVYSPAPARPPACVDALTTQKHALCTFFHCSLLCHRCQHRRTRIPLYVSPRRFPCTTLRVNPRARIL